MTTGAADAAERFRVASAVYGLLLDGERVLLLRRAGSGYRDGELSLPAGHLDGDEDAVTGLLRELREELTIIAEPSVCRLTLVMHRARETARDYEYLDLVFMVDSWAGTPSIGEPDKCSELVWADRDRLPADTIDYIGAALHAIGTGQRLLLYGWDRPMLSAGR